MHIISQSFRGKLVLVIWDSTLYWIRFSEFIFHACSVDCLTFLIIVIKSMRLDNRKLKASYPNTIFGQSVINLCRVDASVRCSNKWSDYYFHPRVFLMSENEPISSCPVHIFSCLLNSWNTMWSIVEEFFLY